MESATLARQYLLGTLPREDAARVEREFLSDDEVFEEIEIAEDELIDAYVSGELSDAERSHFESSLRKLPRVAERIKFAKVLNEKTLLAQVVETRNRRPAQQDEHVDATTDTPVTSGGLSSDKMDKPLNMSSEKHIEQKSWFAGWWPLVESWFTPSRIGAMATAAVLIIVGSLLFFDWLRLRRESERLMAQRAELERQNQSLLSQSEAEKQRFTTQLQNTEAENEKLNEQLENLRDVPRMIASAISFPLFPGGSRGSGSVSDLRLPDTVTMINFKLALESNDYPRYIAVLRKVDGPEIVNRKDLKASSTRSGTMLTLRVSSARLKSGDYIITVGGVRPANEPDPVASYTFRVKAN